MEIPDKVVPILDYAEPGVGGSATLRPDLEKILDAGPTARQFSSYFDRVGLAKQYLIQSFERRFSAAKVSGICAACKSTTADTAVAEWTFSIPPVNQHRLVLPKETNGSLSTHHSMCEACLLASLRWQRNAHWTSRINSALSYVMTAGLFMIVLAAKFAWSHRIWMFGAVVGALILQLTLPAVERYFLRRSTPESIVKSLPIWMRYCGMSQQKLE